MDIDIFMSLLHIFLACPSHSFNSFLLISGEFFNLIFQVTSLIFVYILLLHSTIIQLLYILDQESSTSSSLLLLISILQSGNQYLFFFSLSNVIYYT